ncbi:MAG: response regulator transcription factor [Planctomycetaceae bacterium]|nr:response regulator transcription factor [Planctomycetaceae bacterium]
MSKQKILVIEDERDIAEMIAMRLQKEMFVVKTAGNGTTGWETIADYHPDLLILDLMLPGMSGLEILKRVRADRQMKHLPILILSARGEESDIVVGLELGADDYLTKPFSMSILVARINVILRRTSGKNEPENERFTIGRLCIDIDKHQVFVGEEPVTLTLTEFRLLAALASARGRVLPRDQLIERAIGSDAIVTDRTIDVHLNSIRGKLGEARSLIETVRGIGYRMADNDGRH